MARKISKKSKRRLVVFGTLSIVSIVFFFIILSNYITSIYKLNMEKKRLEEELVKLENEEDNLKIQIEMLKDEDYLAKYARENYLYSKDGEIVLKIDEDEDTKVPNDEMSIDTKYVIYIGSGMIGLLILYVIFKKDK